jgi:DNA adenine methylase
MINDNVREKFVELNAITYLEPFVGGGAVLFDLLSARTPTSPFLKWAGGKTKLLPEIRARLPSSGVPFHRTIRKFVVYDINPELVLCYNMIKRHVNELIEELRKLSEAYPYWDKEVDSMVPQKRKDYYYSLRAEWNSNVGKDLSIEEQIRRVAQMIFLNRTCYNGLFRVNKKGEFNVPIGSYVNPTILFENNLIRASMALKHVEIIHGEYYDCENLIHEKSFVYFDPPYRPLTTSSSFTTYTKSGFNDKNQFELAAFFSTLAAKGAKLMLSNSDPKNEDINDDFFDELYSDYNIQRVTTIHAINSDGDGREPINEILVSNYW